MTRSSACAWMIAGAAVIAAGSSAQAQVTPNGATATSVATAPSGRIGVSIAPVTQNGTSINHYSAFSVPQAGVVLNNRAVGANTIVNEVHGTSRSFLNGPLTVDGTRAHVILVNPNGVTVDGASFVNTGGVAIGVGPLRYENGNAVLGTGTGDIDVTGAGLAGTMTSLQLIAGKLRIDGPVVNSSASPNADISLVAANHDVTLDSSVAANSTLRPWASRRDLGGSGQGILIDITRRGALSASRVQLAVTARGAGVSFAGAGLASIGEFTIGANGRVSVNGGRIQAEKTAKITAPSIEILNGPLGQGAVQSLSGAVTLLARSGDIDLRGYVSGALRDGDDPDSRGAVTLEASGDIRLLSESAHKLAIAFASEGDLVLRAGGAVRNNTGRLISNATTRIESASVANVIDVVGGGGSGPTVTVVKGRRLWPSFFGRRKTKMASLSLGELRLPGQLAYIVGRSVQIQTGELRNSGEIDALDGSMIIAATSVLNEGVATGSMSFTKRCGYFCSSTGSSDISISGGVINSAFGMQITASDRIANMGGRITAYGNMELTAPAIAAEAAYVPLITSRPGGLKNVFSGRRSFLAFAPVGGQFVAPLGSITIRTDRPVSVNGGELLTENGVDNPAGQTGTGAAVPISRVGTDHIGLVRSWFE